MTNKFRVWDKVTQSYGGGDLWSINASGQVFYGNAEWNECVVEWFIGCVDKNSKEIYEGDIVKTDEADWIAEVVYGLDQFCCRDNKGGFSSYCNWGEFEVIGNIHEKEVSNDKP